MKITRHIMDLANRPAVGKAVMIDTDKGAVRARAWPRPRGRPKSAAVRNNNRRFAEASDLARFASRDQVEAAIQQTKGSSLYPRDLLMKAMLSGQFDIALTDGRVITPYSPSVEPVMFQGARLQRSSAFALPANVQTPISWDNPQIDTGTFWSAGAPTRLTIPSGVNTVILDGGYSELISTSGFRTLFVRLNGGAVIGSHNQVQTGLARLNVSSGPVSVVPGDYFELVANNLNANSFDAIPATFFGLHVVGAT